MGIKTLVLVGAAGASPIGCAKGGGGGSTPKFDTIVTVAGKAQAPAVFLPTRLFADGNAGYSLAYSWQNCFPSGATNESGVQGVNVTLESAKSCAGPQYLYFDSTAARDMSDYAQGIVTFVIENSVAGMGLSLQIQDDASKASTALDLTAYGFDASKAGLAQSLAVPVSKLATGGVDLTKLKRLFHVIASCPIDKCFTKFNKIQWSAIPPAAPTKKTGATLALAGSRCRGIMACRPITQRPVRLVRATPLGWSVTGTNYGVADGNGDLTIETRQSELTDVTDGGSPVLLGISDESGDVNLMSIIGADLLHATTVSADLTVDIDITTTLTAMIICPGGTAPAADGSYCLRDAAESTLLGQLDAAIDAYLEAHPPETDNLDALLVDVLGDSGVQGAITPALATASLPTLTAQAISDLNSSHAPPASDLPAGVSSGGTGSGTAGSGSSATGAGSGSTPPADFPTNITAGSYLMSSSICVQGSCQPGPQQTIACQDGNELFSNFASSLSSSCAQASSSGATCTTSYSAFDGHAFTATTTVTSTSGGQTATVTTTWTFTKQ